MKQLKRIKDYLLSLNHLHKAIGFSSYAEAIKSEINLQILDQPPHGNALVIAPHPDDDVFGCGGTIKSMTKNGQSVSVVYLSNGKNDCRKKEAEKASEHLETKIASFWPNKDFEIDDDLESIQNLKKLIDEINPDIIFSVSPADPNPDHIEAAKLLARTLEITDYKGQIFAYEIWQPLFANRLVKIDKEIEDKKIAIKAHDSQLKDRSYLDAIVGLNAYRAGMFNAGKYAEAFFACSKELYLKLYK